MTSVTDAINAYNEKLSKMSVQNQIEFEMKASMKNGNPTLRDLLRVVMGEFAREGKELTDEQALKVIKKMHSNAVELENDYEVAVLERWLPKMLSEEDMRYNIRGMIALQKLAGIQNMGKVMAEIKKYPNANQYDMKLANKIVKEELI